MGENSNIEWTHHTFNPWIGCAKVHEGCTNCYAETMMDKRYGRAKWGVNGTRTRTSAAYWKDPLKWNREAEKSGERKRVFCASLADVFEDRPELESWRQELFELIDKTPWLDWLLLTKRPENIRRMWVGGYRENVWLGTSVSNQPTLDTQAEHLRDAVGLVAFGFLSIEPLLGPIDVSGWVGRICSICGGRGVHCDPCSWTGWEIEPDTDDEGLRAISWVIVGGESGPGARPMNPQWVRTLKDQCVSANVAFHFKQWGEFLPDQQNPEANPGERLPLNYTGAIRVGKKAAGRLLDGRTWSQYPDMPTLTAPERDSET